MGAIIHIHSPHSFCLLSQTFFTWILFFILHSDWVFFVLSVKFKGTLKQQISTIKPVLEDLRLKKQGRMKEFFEIQLQISGICTEIAGTGHSVNPTDPKVNEQDLTLKRLMELKAHLKELQNEKVSLEL